ncbi:MAG TPA: DUF84 family protein [Candidatus Paceibacterota bacterium]|jgi:inosine/xanthosine triphosphatase|nr:DUF84 family protein [Candidatus Paceibacterota bacterium]
MKIGVGSKNKTKVDAVAELLKTYPMFHGAEVVGVDVKIDQFGHPKSLKEVVEGAIDRAKQSKDGYEYGFGIESGLMEVSYTKSGYMEVVVCAIYDGIKYHLGIGPTFEWPTAVVHAILKDGVDGSQAFKKLGFTDHEKLGTENGSINILTHGKMNRKEQNKIAVMMALIHLENPEHFL